MASVLSPSADAASRSLSPTGDPWLLTPGPLTTSPSVKAAMAHDLGSRDPAFIEQVVAVPGADVEIAYMTAPGHTLELIEYRGPAGRGAVRPRPSDTGATHIAFNVDAIEAVVTAVRAAGFTVLSDPLQVTAGPNAGAKVVYTQDPDGVTIEFIQPPPHPASAPGTEP